MLKDETRAVAPRIDIHGAFVRRADLSRASLRGANLSGADASNAVFTGADFAGAQLRGTILHGADLTDVKNLTLDQLAEADFDDRTVLPSYIDRTELRERVSNRRK